jgi:hypothetical protein
MTLNFNTVFILAGALVTLFGIVAALYPLG